ncbi:hypothetical protein BpHYR1_042987 [Brachionus plicatilis]|uniref:Uncharacterized protein n=1 Tax=Brachionus plicatilis TaxID=10195 RepID=A0A3M7PNS1_BRAPC|nr:hypothetical protein BpHYR1_042987 [Brachionus plicatilis]
MSQTQIVENTIFGFHKLPNSVAASVSLSLVKKICDVKGNRTISCYYNQLERIHRVNLEIEYHGEVLYSILTVRHVLKNKPKVLIHFGLKIVNFVCFLFSEFFYAGLFEIVRKNNCNDHQCLAQINKCFTEICRN